LKLYIPFRMKTIFKGLLLYLGVAPLLYGSFDKNVKSST